MPVRRRSASFRASTLSVFDPSPNSLFRLGSHTITSVTWGRRTSATSPASSLQMSPAAVHSNSPPAGGSPTPPSPPSFPESPSLRHPQRRPPSLPDGYPYPYTSHSSSDAPL